MWPNLHSKHALSALNHQHSALSMKGVGRSNLRCLFEIWVVGFGFLRGSRFVQNATALPKAISAIALGWG